jgi:dihydrodipicolinate synthase/N-acetylneuraminate lyase
MPESDLDMGRAVSLSRLDTLPSCIPYWILAMPLPKPLRGIIPPLVTPLYDQNHLDVEGLERLVVRLIEAGVDGLFLLGTTGEGPSLSRAIRSELVRRVLDLNKGRVPTVVCAPECSPAESLAFALEVAEMGADAVVLLPPFYFSLSQQELLDYFRRIIPRMPLPVFLYDIPSHTHIHLEAETILCLASLPNFAGLKDSTGDLGYLALVRKLTREYAHLALLCGPEEILVDALETGAHGGVSGGANLWPGLYTGAYKAWMAGEKEEARRLQRRIRHLADRLYTIGNRGSSYLCGLKCALELAGICRGTLAEPLAPFGAAERDLVRQRLDELNVAC